jgi:hypothetical protein
MEIYPFYPPQMQPAQMPYHELVTGDVDCQHQLAEAEWVDRISVRDGLVFISYSCRHCGRLVCQSLEQVQPPASWRLESD